MIVLKVTNFGEDQLNGLGFLEIQQKPSAGYFATLVRIALVRLGYFGTIYAWGGGGHIVPPPVSSLFTLQ